MVDTAVSGVQYQLDLKVRSKTLEFFLFNSFL